MDGWMDGWMDGEVLIIGKVVGWSGWVPKGLPCCKLRCGARLFFSSFFLDAIFLIFFDVGAIWGGFGRSKRRPKSIFGRFFFDVFFECVSASIFNGF